MRTTKVILFFLLPCVLLLQTCKKVEKEMLVSTGTVSNILTTTADVSGKILDLGQGATQYGHCFSKTSNPTISDSKVDHNSPSLGDFSSTLQGLDAGTKYYVRAYLSRGKDVVYGNEINFTTASADLPELTTTTITAITKTSAVSGGNITNQGGTPVIAKGVCWSLATITSLTNNKTTDGAGTGTFTSEITGLTAGTNYFVRAYATNSGGTKLGNEITFTTTPDTPIPPTVTTTVVNSVTTSSAISGGNVTSEGSSSVIARGVCWNTSPNPKTSDSKTTNGSGSGLFVSNLTSLSPGTTYYLRAYATNSAGTSYADAIYEYSFTTLCLAPSVMTNTASGTGNATAVLNGTVNANGFSTTVSFEYGLTTSYGSTVTGSQSPVIGSSNTDVSAGISGLIPNNTYHFRIKGINCEGTAIYGVDQQFVTNCTAPSVSTDLSSSVGNTTATLNGTVNPDGFSTTVSFEYGLTTSYGNSATASQSPVTGSSNTAVSAGIAGLTPNTTYHFRVKAINCEGTTVYGIDQQFITNCTAPSASTNTASSIGSTTSILNGTVNANSSSTLVSFDYGLTISYGSTATASQSPVTGSSNTAVNAGITSLTPNTTYHFRVKAINCEGTPVYGNDQQFVTNCTAPLASTNTASSIGNTSATFNGTVNPNGFSTIVSFEYGLTTGYGNSATALQSPVTGSSNTAVNAGIVGLAPNSTYHFRIKALNCEGTPIYGIDEQFITNCTAPSASINTASNIGNTLATLNGTINPNGFSTTVSFEYGLTTSYGNSATASQSPVTGSSSTAVSVGIVGLSPGALYHYRVKTVNCGATIYSPDQQFSTVPLLPTVTTTAASSITSTSATTGGNVTADGGASVTSRGVCWSVNPNPNITNSTTTNGTGTGIFTSSMTGLTLGNTYYVRAYATNIAGTGYGNQICFRALAIGDNYPTGGGKVAYILQPGDLGYDANVTHGLIAAPSDQSTGSSWGCFGTTIAGADGTAIGTGSQNTIDILAGCATIGIAAEICSNFVMVGSSDWYLPSKDELNKLYINRVAIGGFTNNNYWSSTESSSNMAWYMNFNNGLQFDFDKRTTYYVRAIRSF